MVSRVLPGALRCGSENTLESGYTRISLILVPSFFFQEHSQPTLLALLCKLYPTLNIGAPSSNSTPNPPASGHGCLIGNLREYHTVSHQHK
ncbi:protein of unknown function [Xenorhabdus doucetiae]|uniref:Uncharacterized protein n=1 Tax=Xenorhabdus doucetiae TaxID=351671 RepID=A0A068QRT7_9GAMM|nr:protein of unknown function [Xenorhabdus doucetiae]